MLRQEETHQEDNWDEVKPSQEEMIAPETCKVETWDDFHLRDDLLRGIFGYGFESPSEIQKKAILPLMSGKDVIAQAQSGSLYHIQRLFQQQHLYCYHLIARP